MLRDQIHVERMQTEDIIKQRLEVSTKTTEEAEMQNDALQTLNDDLKKENEKMMVNKMTLEEKISQFEL